MAYERLDIEVTDNGSSRRVQRSIEDLARVGRKSATDMAQEMARAAVSGSSSNQLLAGVLAAVSTQFSASARAALMYSSAMGTVGAAAAAAARPITIMGTALTVYSGTAAISSQASLLASTGMGTVGAAAIGASAPIGLLTFAYNANAIAAAKAAAANKLLTNAVPRQLALPAPTRQLALPAPPRQLALPDYTQGNAGAAGAAAAAAGASNYTNVLQRLRGVAGSARGSLGNMWTGIRTGASSAAGAVGTLGSRLRALAASGGGAGRAAAGISQIGAAARQASSALITMNTLMYSLQLGLVAVAAIKFADEWQSIQNKLDLVTGSTSELTAANERLYQVAQKTRTGYSDVVELFQSLRLQAENLGLSMEATAQLTETLSMASQIGSKGPQQSAAGLMQLTQAMALGRLSGQNLNSVLMSTPRITIAIAKGMGVASSSLRKLAEDEKLTADVIVKALQDQAPVIAEEFLRLEPTISGAFTVLSNGAIKFMGEIEKTTGFAAGLAEMVIQLSYNMDLLAAGVVIVGSALLVAFGGAAQRAVIAVGVALAANPIGAFIALVISLIAVWTILQDKFVEYPALAAAFAGAVTLVAVAIAGPLWTAIVAATSATIAWTIALLANPFVWIAIAIAAVVAAIVYFGQKTYDVNGKTVTGWTWLRAVAVGTWDAIVAGAKALWRNLANIFNQINQGIYNLGRAFWALATGDFDAAISIVSSSFGNLAGTFNSIGAEMGGAFNSGFNSTIASAPKVIPGGEQEEDTALSAVGTPAVPYASDKKKKKKKGGEKRMTRAELIDAEMKSILAATTTANNLAVNYLNRAAYEGVDAFNEKLRNRRDPLLNPQEQKTMLDALMVMEKAKRVQQQRDNVLRDAIGPAQDYADTLEGISQLEKSAAITHADAEAARRKAAIAYHSTQRGQMDGRIWGLAQVMDKIMDQASPVAEAVESIWSDANDPLIKYEAGLKAINELEINRLLTTEQQVRATRKLRIEYLQTLRDLNSGKELGGLQIQEILDDKASPVASAMVDIWQSMNGPLREYEAGLEAVAALLEQGIVPSLNEAARLNRDLRIEYLSNTAKTTSSGLELGQLKVGKEIDEGAGQRVASMYVSQWEAANKGMLEYQANTAVLKQLMIDDPIHSGYYASQLRALGQQALELKLKLNYEGITGNLMGQLNALAVGFGRLANDFEGIIPGMADAWGDFFADFSEGFADVIGKAIWDSENLGVAIGDVARSAISSLISALIQLGIQWLVMQVIGQSTQGAVASSSAAAGATVAAAWMPAAVAVSLATFGANAPPAMGGMAATFGLGTALSATSSAITKSAGFKNGGHVRGPGTGTSDSIFARLSDGEYVVNAKSTKAFLPILEMMNKGELPTALKGNPGMPGTGYNSIHGQNAPALFNDTNRSTVVNGADMNVQVHNHAAAAVSIERASPTEMRVVVRDEIRKQVPQMMAGELRNPSSRPSQALAAHTKTVRKRG